MENGHFFQFIDRAPVDSCRALRNPMGMNQRRRRGIFVELANNFSQAPEERHKSRCRS